MFDVPNLWSVEALGEYFNGDIIINILRMESCSRATVVSNTGYYIAGLMIENLVSSN